MNHNTSSALHASEPAESAGYDPGTLLDLLLLRLQLTRDSQLACRLNMDRRVIARIRARETSITGSMLMMMQDATGIPVEELRRALRDRRKTSRMLRTYRNYG